MSTHALIAVAVTTAVIFLGVSVAVWAVGRGARTGGGTLRRRFGPEYDAVLARHGGERKAAERELSERLGRYEHLRVSPLPAAAREQYVARWTGIQERFVDAPARSVADAELLVGELARDRGFPSTTWDDMADALSVHAPRSVHGLRELHTASVGGRSREVPTEELREALVRARDLFEDLVRARPEDHRPQRHARRGGPRPAVNRLRRP
ncbi:hypothetical protein [Streptomyces triculaminicus]|uniref:hypothetical protein n=1 Tax=Streptomyces triculaminicus TaxID=2816232 RepID=UPI0037CFB4E7